MQVPKWICFVASWILVASQDAYDGDLNPDTQNYQYRYYVRDESTGDIKSQEETKLGGTVNGHYTVGEPTGDLRVVTYTADEGGFRADVKYEEGGSPASEDKARQVNSKSGVEFHWLPANPDDLQEGKTGTEESTSDGSVEASQSSSTESTTINTSDQHTESISEATTESTSHTEANSEPSTTESLEVDGEIEKVSKEADSSSESTNTLTENSMESSTMTSAEGKETDEEIKPPTEDEQGTESEAAESAPLSEEVLPPLPPSQMYLPVISYQNLPYLNLPMLGNTEKPSTIIYASQNFYNPWQWFGNTRRIARDIQQHIDRHIQTSEKGFPYPVLPR